MRIWKSWPAQVTRLELVVGIVYFLFHFPRDLNRYAHVQRSSLQFRIPLTKCQSSRGNSDVLQKILVLNREPQRGSKLWRARRPMSNDWINVYWEGTLFSAFSALKRIGEIIGSFQHSPKRSRIARLSVAVNIVPVNHRIDHRLKAAELLAGRIFGTLVAFLVH